MKPRSRDRYPIPWQVMLAASVLLFVAGCNTSTSVPSPTPADVAQAEPPSIALNPPGPVIEVEPGDTIPISAFPKGTEPQVSWTATCLMAGAACSVLESEAGADNYFKAPETPGEMVTVRATVKDKYGREDSAVLTFQVQEAQTASTPVPVTATDSSLTDTPTDAAAPEISSLEPPPEECVSNSHCLVRVEGSWVPEDDRSGLQLYVLIRPIPADLDQSYWVQSLPTILPNGDWSASSVYIGQPGDKAGLPFKVCALATGESLHSGDSFTVPPSGPMACLEVNRGTASASEETPSPTPSLPSELPSDPEIVSLTPNPEDCSPAGQCTVRADGLWVAEDDRGGLQLYLLVRPLPDDPANSYWVQVPVTMDPEGRWYAAPIYIGQSGDRPGMPFKVCVIATNEPLAQGQSLLVPPEGPMTCLDVTRGQP